MMQRIALLLVLFFAMLTPVNAVEPDEVLDDPALEQRARGLSAELRCLVCQNQSIDDSDAELARDLRILVRERLKAGDTDGQVIDYVVSRYGEFVLLKPRWSGRNLALWLSAPLILLAGAAAFLVYVRRSEPVDERLASLSESEQRELDRLLSRGDVDRTAEKADDKS